MKPYDKISLIGIEVFALILMLVPASALAADACPTGSICFAEYGSMLREFLQAALLAAVTGLVGYGIAYLRSKWNLNVSEATEATITKAISDAGGIGLARIESVAKFDMKVGNPLIADLANWALAQIPGMLAQKGITPDKERLWLEERIVAWFGHATKDEPDTAAENPTRL